MGSDDEKGAGKDFPMLEGLTKVNGSGPSPYEGFLVKPNIVPSAYRFLQVQGPDHIALVLELHTPTGMHITFWPGKSGEQFAAEMLKAGRATASGLILPPHRLNPTEKP